MPIAKLYVEGSLELEILFPILKGLPALQQGGSKYSLRPRACAERRENRVDAGYLRDRDFDYDPPTDLSQPTVDYVDQEGDSIPIGWRWCRHEIENYLIEPVLVNEATAWPLAEIEDVICQVARTIRSYEAARWTIGSVRRALPPYYELETRPEDLSKKEIALPSALDYQSAREWAWSSIEAHRSRIAAEAEPSRIQGSFDAYVARFDDAFVSNVANVLLWFPGKDILAGMADWLRSRGDKSPKEFRSLLRDWIRENPDRALQLLPEWNNLIRMLRE